MRKIDNTPKLNYIEVTAKNAEKTKIAFLDLTGCSGCEVNLLRLDTAFLDMIQDFEVTSWRMLQTGTTADYDVVFVEGYACNDEQVELLKQARATCSLVVAVGVCAMSGHVFSQITPENLKNLKALVYSPEHQTVTQFVKPVAEVVKVDHVIPGCPANIEVAAKLLNELRQSPVTSKIQKVYQPNYVARIEGHGSLKADFKKETAHFHPEEGERFTEALVLGKPYLTSPRVHSRICGICPVAHCICSIKAIENALEIQPNIQSRRLRRIFQCGQMVQSHLLHLYLMILPSIAELGSSLDVTRRYPAEFHIFLEIKRVTEEFFDIIGGAPLHPVALTVGGFSKAPDSSRLFSLEEKISRVLNNSLDLVRFFSEFDWPEAVTAAHMLCIQPEIKDIYPMFGVRIRYNNPEPFAVGDYREFINESIVPGCPSKVACLAPNIPIKTGALARLFYYHQSLNPMAGKVLKESNLKFSNPFHTNIAQAIEIIHYLEEAIRLLGLLQSEDLGEVVVDRKEVRQQALENSGLWPKKGVSAIEAPRGLLFHEAHIDKQGNVTLYNIIPPTVLNLASLEQEASLLLRSYRTESNDKKTALLEELVRAMDPCITCAVH
ncbi:MAG: nickel-dependent hydrogenase large subunit [Desulfocapsa sp.]|nr:nickel-dependent hydrogenase large subunit [Desulfocapsa sp.]